MRAVGDHVYALAPESGKLAAFDSTGHQLWSVAVTPGSRGLAVVGDQVVVGDPVNRMVVRLDATTGRVQLKRNIGCRPWDLAPPAITC